ncbi:hypothetical protein [Phytohabitans suffuscus]|uniref:hypothetical protein n=1 Tax=Phytohabitans suffuscus TaxID=624315 RepID=UPI001565C15F|nr:hypothetical protein [Phytohabitans suffuscus]
MADERGSMANNPPEVEQQIALNRAMERTLERLPEHDANFGREVYTALAESADHINRGLAGSWVGNLTRVDHDYGVMLWDRLVRDEKSSVRYEAYAGGLRAGVAAIADMSREVAEEKLSAIGLTLLDGIDLFRAFEYARQGHNLHALGDRARREQHAPEVGRAALRKLLVNLTSLEDS